MRKLTQEEFNRFDLEARKVGVGLFVVDRSEMRPDGYCTGVLVPALINGLETEIQCIILPDEIDTEKWGTTQSGVELDRTKIPEHLVYPFLIHHECAHARYGHGGIMTHRERFGNLPEGPMRTICEMLADRYAWRKIMPGVPLPVVASRKDAVKKFDAFVQRNKAAFKSFESKLKAIPADAYVVVVGLM